MPESPDITELLRAVPTDPDAAEAVYARLFDELKVIARRHLSGERADHTLQPTALVNEAFLKLAKQSKDDWENRNQFFAIASRIIRRILVDHSRHRDRIKRGGGAQHVPLTLATHIAVEHPATDLLALDEALTKLRDQDPVKCEVVEMRFFGGLNNPEIAKVLGVSSRTVERHWKYSKAWLFRALSDGTAA